MAAKRHANRPRSGRTGGNKGFDDEDAGSGKSGEDAIPKEMPLKGAEERSPPSPADAGPQGSGEASPARRAPRGGVAMKTKKPPPASHGEDEAEDSGDTSPAGEGELLVVTADAGHSKRAATPKRGEKRSPPQRQEEEPPKKRAAGLDAETVAASPRRKKKNKRNAEKERRKKERRKQRRKAFTKLTLPSSPGIAQADEHHGREMAGQEQSNTPTLQDEPRAREEEQQEKKIAEQEHAGDILPPQDDDMHSAHGEEEQPEMEVANQEHADDTSSQKDNHSADEEEQQGEGILQQEQPKDTAAPQEENRAQEDEETGDQVNGKALQGRRNTKPRGSVTQKKPADERSWSYDDELKILNALVGHAQSNDGALPESSQLLANLTFDKIDANEDKLTDKIRKLRTRYRKLLSQGCPSDGPGRRLFKLSESLWGQGDEDKQVESTSRDLSVLSKLYPHLAKEVKAYAETHSSGDLIMANFMTISDEKARNLDAKCKKQQIETLKLELSQASLTNELLSALV